MPAGEPSDEGQVLEGTVNFLVAAQLAELSALRQAFAAAGRLLADEMETTNEEPAQENPGTGEFDNKPDEAE